MIDSQGAHLSVSKSTLRLDLSDNLQLVKINLQPLVCVARYRLLRTPRSAIPLRADPATIRNVGRCVRIPGKRDSPLYITISSAEPAKGCSVPSLRNQLVIKKREVQWVITDLSCLVSVPFSTLTLLVGRQEVPKSLHELIMHRGFLLAYVGPGSCRTGHRACSVSRLAIKDGDQTRL